MASRPGQARRLLTLAGGVCLSLLAGLSPGAAQDLQLHFAERPRLLDCSPSTSRPVFAVRANIADPSGAPAGTAMPPAERLTEHVTVLVDGVEMRPFYAAAGADKSQMLKRVALVLIDASGSMLARMPTGETRYDASKAALRAFLQDFETGNDEVAIVPFESHNVIPRIRQARFAATPDEAVAQVEALPIPEPRNNTALYSAVDAALTTLAARTDGMQAEVQLIVLTDGKNDVQAGDDPGLLGDEGRALVANRVAASGIEVVGVGLGDARSIDVEAMRQISTRFFLVSDAEGLRRSFSFARTMLLNRLLVSFFPPYQDRASLAGKNLEIGLKLKLESGQEFASASNVVWSAPQMGAPVYEGRCGPAEVRAAMTQTGEPGGWLSTVRPILVFAGLGAMLLALWFWIPRLVWPEQYLGEAPVRPTRGRWESGPQGARQAPGPAAGAPRGFTAAGGRGGGQMRAPDDKTVVAPRAPSTRTRLAGRGGPPGRR